MNLNSHLVASFWQDIASIIPGIGTVYALLAFAVFLAVLAAMLFFREDTSVRRERVFIYIIIFVSAMMFAAIFSLRTSEAITDSDESSSVTESAILSQQDAISLSPSMQEELERHILAEGDSPTIETQTQIIEEALARYFEGEDSSSELDMPPPSNDEGNSDDSDELLQASQTVLDTKTVSGYKLDLYGCLRTDESGVIVCNLFVTNEKEDRTLRVYSQNNPESRIVTSDGVPYESSKIEYGGESESYQADIILAQDVGISLSISFADIPENGTGLSLLEINSYTYSDREYSKFQFRDIEISN